MDCLLAHRLLALGPKDLAGVDTAHLESHLAACPTCSALARRDRAVDSLLRVAMNAVSIPDGLHRRLLQGVSAKQSAAHGKQLLRWASLAAAAVVALAIGLGANKLLRPAVDTDKFAQDQERASWDPHRAGENFLTAEKLPTDLPVPLDYRTLDGCGYEKLDGQLVPVLRFRLDREKADVFVLRESQFNLQSAVTRSAQSSRHKVDVVGHPRQKGLLYLIVYTSDTLQPFLLPPPG